MKMTKDEWVREVKVGAARQFGAKHYRTILGLAVLRRVALPLGVLVSLALVAYLVVGASGYTLGVILTVLGLGGVALVAVLAWKHLSWVVTSYVPIPGPVVGALGFMLLVGVGALLLTTVVR